MTRTIITILTWNRLEEYTKNTVKTLCEMNKGRMRDIIFIDNGSTDGTQGWIRKRNYEVICNESNEGIFMASRKIWLEAVRRGYDFILNLQNDFPCLSPVPFDDIEGYLDANDDVGFVRLNEKKKKPGRDVNKITGKKLKFDPFEKFGKTKFSKHNHNFSFNPNLFRTSLVDHLVNPVVKQREWQIAERFEQTGLRAAKIEEPCPCFKTFIRPRIKHWIH
jgi:glycosyltransferase involved in cell wall biosynthesis